MISSENHTLSHMRASCIERQNRDDYRIIGEVDMPVLRQLLRVNGVNRAQSRHRSLANALNLS